MAVVTSAGTTVIAVGGPAGISIPGPKGDPSTVPGPKGADGRDGIGITPKGSFATLAGLPSVAEPGDTYLATADDTADPKRFLLGDGLVWTGSGSDLGPGGNYHNVGPVRGPPGTTSVDGLEDATPAFKALNVADPSAPGNPIGDALVAKAPLDSPRFDGVPQAHILGVGRQASPDGNNGGLLIGGGSTDEGGAGTYIAADFLANWCRVQPSKNYNPQEFNIYGAAAQGFASVSAGGNTITRTTSAGGDPGSPFDSSWVGQTFYWAEKIYRVDSVIDASRLTVKTIYGGPVAFPTNSTDRYHFFRTTTRTIVNVNGKQVTRVSGDPLVPFFDPSPDRQDCILKINGVAGYRVEAFQSTNSLTLMTSAGVQNNVVLAFSINIYDQISTIRLQKTTGIDEENLNFMARADGYDIIVSIANGGKYYPLRIKNGDGGGFPQTVAEFKPDVTTIGGVYSQGALTVKNGVGANRFEIEPSAAGFSAALRARGSDANVSATYDAQGAGNHAFTGRSFGQTLFEISGAASANLSWVKVSPGGTPTLQPNGADGNAPIALLGRGVSGALFGAFVRNANPTTSDIPSGQGALWINTGLNQARIWINNGGALQSFAFS